MKNVFFYMCLSFMLTMCGSPSDVESVAYVDLNKYVGKWYEVASFPQRFQKGCYNTTANYSLSDEGYVIVENRCLKGSAPSKESYIKGKAFIVPGTGNARLKVQFFWPFQGKYWIIDLAEDYSYAVVGHPNKKYLWILSKTIPMEEEIYNHIIQKVSDMGFNTSLLVKTKHI